MFYKMSLKSFPKIEEIAKVTRNTSWEITAEHNMFFFINDGTICYSSHGEPVVLKKGDIFFVPQGTRYKRTPLNAEPCVITYLSFKTDVFIKEIDTNEEKLSLIEQKNSINESILSGNYDADFFDTIYLQSKMSPTNFAPIEERLKQIKLLSSKAPLMMPLQSSVALCDILVRLSQITIDTIMSDLFLKEKMKIPSKLTKALGYILANFSSPLSLNQIAEHCGVTKQQINRYFNQYFHATPSQYIAELKMAKAKELLFRQPDMKVKDIAAMTGYDDQLYFSRLFKKITGKTPSEFRHHALNYPLTLE